MKTSRTIPALVTAGAVFANALYTAYVSSKFSRVFADLGHSPAFPNNIYTQVPVYVQILTGVIVAALVWLCILRLKNARVITLFVVTVWLAVIVNFLLLAGSSLIEVMGIESGLKID